MDTDMLGSCVTLGKFLGLSQGHIFLPKAGDL